MNNFFTFGPVIHTLNSTVEITSSSKPTYLRKPESMAAFLDFPEELILEVVGFVLPENLENFAQSCKRIRSAACSALKQHRQLIRQHSLMKTEGGCTISKTLKEVLVNPVIGHYIYS